MASYGEAQDQKAAEQLNVEIIPGTEVMKDVGDVHFAHAGGSERGSVYVDLATARRTDADRSTALFLTLQAIPQTH